MPNDGEHPDVTDLPRLEMNEDGSVSLNTDPPSWWANVSSASAWTATTSTSGTAMRWDANSGKWRLVEKEIGTDAEIAARKAVMYHNHLCLKCQKQEKVRNDYCSCGNDGVPDLWEFATCEGHVYHFNPIRSLKKILAGKLSKEALTGRAKIAIWPWEPRKGSERGGVVVYVRSADLEHVFRELAQSANQTTGRITVPCSGIGIIEAPKLYRCGMDANARYGSRSALYGQHVFVPVFEQIASYLVRASTVNCMFLLGVGLSEGVKFRLQGVYTEKEIRTFAGGIRTVMEVIYRDVAKAVTVTIEVTPGRSEHVAA